MKTTQMTSDDDLVDAVDRRVKQREIYQRKWVVDTNGPRLAVRNYLEQTDLRRFLQLADERHKISRAAEFGCGYGRMTQVLTEFSTDVVGIEREAFFVEEASGLIPDVRFLQRDDLSRTELPAHSFDVIVSFTFLQHLIDDVAAAVVREMQRCLKPGGHVLICEETDPAHRMGDPADPNRICTIGRTVEQYCQWFSPLSLVATARRRVEPDYPREHTGDYILLG